MSDTFYVLGSGAKAMVYLGMNRATGGFVAVKELALPVDDAEEAGGILAEVQRLRSVSHPNVIQCLGVRAHHDKVHIVLEYCAGGSVARTIRHFGALSEAVCRRYMRDVVCGLAYLHAEGICHRDVKPENLLLTGDGQCKLGDLGSSKTMPEGGGNLATCVGTPQYMAPEVIDGGGGYGTSADVWSLGACAYEMMGGIPFITGSNPMAIMFAIASREGGERVDMPAGVSVTCDGLDFIRQCLQYVPHDRPSTEVLLSHPWLRLDSCGAANLDFNVDDVVTPTNGLFGTLTASGVSGGDNPLLHGEDAVDLSPRGQRDGSESRIGRSHLRSQSDRVVSAQTNAQTNSNINHKLYRPGDRISYSSADFEPIPEHAKTLGAMPSLGDSDGEEDALRGTHQIGTVRAVLRLDTMASQPSAAGAGSPSGEGDTASPLLTACQYCKASPALFECDECRRVFGNLYCLCPICWPKVHSRLAASSAPRHQKRPLLTTAPYSGAAPQSLGRADPAGVPHGERGVLLSNGAFVDLSAYEESGWSCGACHHYNAGQTERCVGCGQLN